MTKIKRIVAFMLATVIFASFCLVNSGATSNLLIYLYDDAASGARFFPNSNNLSCGTAFISDWGEGEARNNLEASTYAYNVLRYEEEYRYVFEAHVDLYGVVDDGYSRKFSYFTIGDYEDSMVSVTASGSNLDDEEYTLVDFTTTHKIYVNDVFEGSGSEFDEETDLFEYYQYGPTVEIRYSED